MRKYHYIPLILALASSCTHDYFPSTGGEDTVICMNARLNTAETKHKVQITGSEVNRTIPMENAVVIMSVGEGPSDTAHVRRDGFAYFDKAIKASDTIRLSSGAASVSVSGLPEPEGSILDATYSLRYSPAGSTVKVRIRRNPDTDNFYIVQLVTRQYAIRDNNQEVLMDDSLTILKLDMEPYPLQKYPRMFVVDSDAFGDNDYCDITLYAVFVAGFGDLTQVVQGEILRRARAHSARAHRQPPGRGAPARLRPGERRLYGGGGHARGCPLPGVRLPRLQRLRARAPRQPL